MKRHLAYLKYVLRHKWFVLVAARHGALPLCNSYSKLCPLWRAIIHDWSKFLPIEWFGYAETFYAPDGSKQYKPSPKFDRAWNHHQKANKHHWQYWILHKDDGGIAVLEMPAAYAREMVADWMGAGRAITGKWRDSEMWEVQKWYEKNQGKIALHPNTRKLVESLIHY